MSSPPAPPTPIETLLRVKRAAEEGAARGWQTAMARRDAAETLQRGLDGEVQAARDDLRARRATAPAGATTAGSGEGRERFWDRLREQIAARAAQADAHRLGPLARARAEAEAAAAAHRAARTAREQVEKLCQKADTDRRTVTARRAEMALDEQSQAARKT